MSTDNVQMQVANGRAGAADNGYEDKDSAKIFSDSTNGYLIHFGQTKDCVGLGIGISTLALQVFLYSIMVAEGHAIFDNDRVSVEIVFGGDCATNTSELICESEEKGNEYAILGFVLLGVFLMGDVLTAIRGFFSVSGMTSKIGAICIISVSVYAAYAGSLFAFQGVYFGSKYDTIVNCIGVLFINDIDERFYTALDNVEFHNALKGICSCICCACCDTSFRCVCVSLCLVIFIVIGIISAESSNAEFLL